MSFIEALFSSSFFVFPAVGAIVFLLTYLWSHKILSWLYQRSIGQKDEIAKYMELMFVTVDDKKLTYSLMSISLGLGLLFFMLFWPTSP